MSYHRQYKRKDDRFGLLVQALREKADLTQAEAATSIGVSERAIQQWESGTTYPAIGNLKELIEVYLHKNAFIAGRERDEAKILWEQATASPARRKFPFDDIWFGTLLRQKNHVVSYNGKNAWVSRFSSPSSYLQQTDWGDADDVVSFYGREQELGTLEQWVLTERCRVVALLGMGGIGKTTLTAQFAHKVAPLFDYILWRSVRNAPSFEELLTNCIQLISEQDDILFPQSIEKRITLLIDLLRQRRCLLILDNVETLLQTESLDGLYRSGYEGYEVLIQRVAETVHQSCLLLTSREMLSKLEPLAGVQAPVRMFRLYGLGQAASQDLLRDKHLFSAEDDWERFIHHYSGNPLALKITATTIRDLFGGDIAAFLAEGPIMLRSLQQLLKHQFARLTELERDILYWLAIERDLVSLETIRANLPDTLFGREVLSALQALRRRCLIERREQGAMFTLQPEVMEYVSEQLVEQLCEEIISGRLHLLLTHALLKARSNEDIRESQIRTLIQPMLKILLAHFGNKGAVEQHLLFLARLLREKPASMYTYGGGNLVNLLVSLKGHLKDTDFSGLVIRQAYLQGIEAQDANFAGAHIVETLFTEPIESIASMVLSPNGVYLAVGSFSGHVRVWRVADRNPVLALSGHSRIVWTLAFSPDSTLLASGGYDSSIKLWEVEKEGVISGRCLKTLVGHVKWVRSIAFSPDGALLVTAGEDETVRVWEVREGKCQRILRGHTGMVWSVAISPDGASLVTGGEDKTVRLWDLHEGTCLQVFYEHINRVLMVAFHPAGELFISIDENSATHLWEKSSGRCLTKSYLKTTKSTLFIAFNPDGTLLASGNRDGTVEVWHLISLESPQHLRTLSGHPTLAGSVAFGPNNRIASISYGGQVRLWDGKSGKHLETLQGYTRMICALAFSPDGKMLVQGDNHGVLRVWDVNTGHCLNTFQALIGCVWSVVFSADGKVLASGGDDQMVKLWKVGDAFGEENIQCIGNLSGHTVMAWSVALSPDGSIVAGSGFDWTVKMWKMWEGEAHLTVLEGHMTFIWSVAFSPDGSMLASGDNDGVIKVWDSEHGHCLVTLQNGSCPIGSLVFSADGKTLLSGSIDETVTQWKVGQEEESHEAIASQGVCNWAGGMTFNQDGTLLAVGCDYHRIKLWQVEEKGNATVPKVFALKGGGVWSMAFSPDSHLLASGDDNGTLALWDVEAGTCRQILRTDMPYQRMNIHGVTGITEAQRDSLKALGAI